MKDSSSLEKIFSALNSFGKYKLPKDWFAIAFDRNLYEKLAPEEAWIAFFRVVGDVHSIKNCYYSKFYGDAKKTEVMEKIELSEKSIFKKLLDDFSFVDDQILVSCNLDWIVLMNQDVTYFSFMVSEIKLVTKNFGSVVLIKDNMMREFDAKSDDTGVIRSAIGNFLENVDR